MAFNRVRLFVRVAEAGSFTGAARLSGLPTSSVSRAVAALERELAVRLIQRTTRRLQLTEAGRVYYESVSRALSGMDEAAGRGECKLISRNNHQFRSWPSPCTAIGTSVRATRPCYEARGP